MSKWWWADYVDEHLTSQLSKCRQRLEGSPGKRFTLEIIIPMSDTDGHWAAWLSFSPVDPTSGNNIRVLVDSASAIFSVPLVMRRTGVSHGIDPEWAVSYDSDPPGVVAHRKDGSSESVVRSKATAVSASSQPYYGQTMALATELCQRHQGKELSEEPDGVVRFVVSLT